MGFPLGKEGAAELPAHEGEDDEVVGLDFVADEQTVSKGVGVCSPRR